MKLLHVDSSILGANSTSRELSAAVVARWQAAYPGLQVVRRDLETDPLPHLSAGSLAGADPAEADTAARTMQEFLEADVVVVGAPMYNFSIPSTLKAWIDRLAVAGKTFRYTADGVQGLAGGKKVIIASSRGGYHLDAPSDFQEPYLRFMFGFFGITDIEFVRVEGLAVTPDRKPELIAAARSRIVEPSHARLTQPGRGSVLQTQAA